MRPSKSRGHVQAMTGARGRKRKEQERSGLAGRQEARDAARRECVSEVPEVRPYLPPTGLASKQAAAAAAAAAARRSSSLLALHYCSYKLLSLYVLVHLSRPLRASPERRPPLRDARAAGWPSRSTTDTTSISAAAPAISELWAATLGVGDPAVPLQ
ncbi:hypothetical protein E2C01_067835 [Portunus trituberculatus]|uniref:Uncharacterized protein n=1 Tax=Portunus trituberculatus TaxID=210409 RepID=A0A5B7HU41_PORTR|nr:hypothetical protein [Portunus trituberculatus]